MSGISHKQAIQFIDRRMDEMLDENQRSLLEEHLRSCDSCRAYAMEMDGFSAHLQNEFHRRWDDHFGPSQNVIGYVLSKAGTIPVTNRISYGVKVFAGAIALVLLAVAINFVVSQLVSPPPTTTNATETIDNLPLPEDRLLAFTAAIENGNLDIYTMRLDGSQLTNLTNDPAHDVNPFWSPNVSRIAFESDRNGFMQIFLMNSDGSNVVQVTNGEADHRFEYSYPWSPDGSRLLITERVLGEEQWMIYVVDVNGKNKTLLVDEPANYSSMSWSPNGEHIVFISNNPQNPETLRMNVVEPDGKNLAEITRLLQKNERLVGFNYDWSSEGQSILFIAYKYIGEGRDQWIAYEASLNSNQLVERATSSTPMDSWWDGTSFITGFDLSTLTWSRQDGTYNTLNALEHCQSVNEPQYGFLAKRSPSGNQLISVNCPNDDIWLYYATSDGTSTKQLLDVPLSEKGFKLSGLVWSPNERFIALNIFSSNRTDMYVMDISEALAAPSIQPLRITLGGGSPMYYGGPSWQSIP